MQKQGSGKITNIASITTMRYIGRRQIAYASAKGAVIRFTKAIGVILAQSSDVGGQEAAKRILEHNCPMGWMGTGADVANALAWLASDASRYVTSYALVVHRGITESAGTGALAS